MAASLTLPSARGKRRRVVLHECEGNSENIPFNGKLAVAKTRHHPNLGTTTPQIVILKEK